MAPKIYLKWVVGGPRAIFVIFVGMQFLFDFWSAAARAPKGDQPRASPKNDRSSHVESLTKTINWSIHVISSTIYIYISLSLSIYIYIYIYIYMNTKGF